MRKEIYFMPLGGGQRVGASCYFLRLGDANILLDMGTGGGKGITFEPDFYSLKTSPFLQGLNQINQVFISHAHSDHIGFLLKFMKEADKPSVYMTEITAVLARYQLYDRAYQLNNNKAEDKRLATLSILDKIVKVSYMQTIDFGKYKVTFFPAGHIPGASMMLFEYNRRKILYTGDYSVSGTILTGGCYIPENYNIDTVIMCELHAKHPTYSKERDKLYKTLNYIFKCVNRGKSVMCHIQQLSKGIELIKLLNASNYGHIPIYIGKSVMSVVERMEQLKIPILDIDNHTDINSAVMPHIFITAKPNEHRGLYEYVNLDFSLHNDFAEMKKFIKKINPKFAYIVHCSNWNTNEEHTIEQELMKDSECRTSFTFAEEKEIYKL